MTGFDSKRQAAQAKLDDEADTLTIVYQRGFADGKRSVQRKPLTEPRIHKLWRGLAQGEGIEEFARAIEAAHNIKEGT